MGGIGERGGEGRSCSHLGKVKQYCASQVCCNVQVSSKKLCSLIRASHHARSNPSMRRGEVVARHLGVSIVPLRELPPRHLLELSATCNN